MDCVMCERRELLCATFCLTRDGKFTKFCKITTRFSAWQRLSCETGKRPETSETCDRLKRLNYLKRGALSMASSSNHDGCRSAEVKLSRRRTRPFRRVAGHLNSKKRIFPQILARQFRIATTFCRQRWFLRYARSESLLYLRNLVSCLQAASHLSIATALPC
jgi:hypothetical protein